MHSKPCGEAECCLGRGNMATSLEPDSMHRCYTDENLITGAAWPGHPEFVSLLMALLGIRVSF
jgi:D-lactate dehydratase